jgi:hypothetical protein
MGTNAQRTTSKYFTIVFGQITRTVSEETPNAKERETKTGKKVFELTYESIYGKITSIGIKEDKKFGDKLFIVLNDGIEVCTVQMPVDSRYFVNLISKLPNLLPTKNYCLAPYEFVNENGKRIAGVNVYEGIDKTGKKIDAYFTKENPNGLPDFPPAPYEKEDIMVYTAQRTKFLKKVLLENQNRFQQTGNEHGDYFDEN